MNHNTIQSLWVEGSLSKMEQLSIRSFLENGYEYVLYYYRPVDGVPEGARVVDAREILSEERLFTLKSSWGQGSFGGGFSDLFRYHLLRKRGGWWVDTDMVCLKKFPAPGESVIASSFEGSYGELANGCVLFTQPDSELAQYLCREADARNPEDLSYAELGPQLVQQAVRALDCQKFVLPHYYFCPIGWRGVGSMVYKKRFDSPLDFLREIRRRCRAPFDPRFRYGRVQKESYFVHFWNEVWRQQELDKNDTYHSSCLYEQLKKRYLTEQSA